MPSRSCTPPGPRSPTVRCTVAADCSGSVDHIRSATATICRRSTASSVATKFGSIVSVNSEYSLTTSMYGPPGRP